MAEAIKKWILSIRFEYPRSIFDMSPGELRYEEPDFTYPSIEECWKRDWENIGNDFRTAVRQLGLEFVA